MGKKILNPEVKEYLIKFAIDKLENCDLFVKVFGTGFVESRLNDNLENVYTNEEDSSFAGYYDHINKSITLCKSGIDSKLLTPNDIDSSESLKSTALHEAVHAILQKFKEECEEMGLLDSSGIYEYYKDGSELGRGLNEGLTNWIVEKAGLNPSGYNVLTNAIRQIELAIGPERVMNLGKGNIHDNIPKILGVSERDATNLLAMSDEYYNVSKIHEKISKITEIFRSRRDDGNIILTGYDINELYKLGLYSITNPAVNARYREFLFNEGMKDTLETKSKYCEMYEKELSKSLKEISVCIDSIIFELFFQEKFNSVRENVNELSKEELDYFLKLSRLMSNDNSDKSKPSVIFMDEFKNKCIINKISKIKEKIDTGTITTKEFLEMIDILDSDSMGLSNQRLLFYTLISQSVYPENADCIKELISKLKQKGNIDEIDRYSFQEIKTSTGEKICLYYKDGEIDFAGSSYCADGIKASEKIEDLDNIFDYTPTLGKDLQVAVNNFLKFKEDVEKRDPNAVIKVSNRAIILETSKGKKAFFMVDDNEEIVPATKVIDTPVKINFAKEKEEQELTIPKKENFISKFINNMRNRIKDRVNKRKEKKVSSDDGNKTSAEDSKETEWEEFDKKLKDFTPTKNPQSVGKKNHNRKFEGR